MVKSQVSLEQEEEQEDRVVFEEAAMAILVRLVVEEE